MSVTTVYKSREDSIAKQQAQQFIEGINAARNTGAISFANIQYISQDPANGLFKDGWQPATQAGPDGLMNTADDLACVRHRRECAGCRLTKADHHHSLSYGAREDSES